MRFGVVLPLTGTDACAVLELAEAAEELGYDSVWLQDDPLGSGSDAPAVLAGIAARTKRVRIGFSILVLPQRETVATARMLATIDSLSGGRLVAGVGVGSARREPLTYPAGRAERGRLMDEQIEVMQRLWRGGEVDFEGRWVRLRGVSGPGPATGHLPIWIGTWGNEGGLRRAVRWGQGWFASGIRTPMDRFAAASRRLDELCAEAGRDPRSIQRGYANCPLALAPKRDEAIAMARPLLKGGYGLEPLEAGVPFIGTATDARAVLAKVGALRPDLVCVFPVVADATMLQRFRDEVAGGFPASHDPITANASESQEARNP